MKLIALGPAGTNGHEAATIATTRLEPVYGNLEIEFVKTNVQILEEAAKQSCFGVVPVENSTGGPVYDVLKSWLNTKRSEPLHVIGEIQLPIRHHLLVHPSISDVGELTGVISHQQAIAQCQKHLQELKVTTTQTTNSTAEAATRVATDPAFRTIGALASTLAGTLNKLSVLRLDMQDASENATTFHIIGPIQVPPTGTDQTAILFQVPDQPRSLLNALWAIGMENANMSSVHSIPLGARGQFAFFAQFSGHVRTDAGRKILQRMRTITSNVHILGSFPQGVEPQKRMTAIEPKRIGIVGSLGRYGQHFERFFKSKGCSVIGCDIATETTLQEVVEQSDVVIFTVDISAAVSVIEKAVPFSRPDQLWIDITSVKSETLRAMSTARSEIVGWHPLFAPPRGLSWQGGVVAIQAKRVSLWAAWMYNVLTETDAEVVVIDSNDHDRIMLGEQQVEHDSLLAAGMAIVSLGLDRELLLQLTTKVSRSFLGSLARMLTQGPKLYFDIQKHNPGSKQMIDAFLSAVIKLKEVIDTEDEKAFTEFFNQLIEYFGDQFIADASRFVE